MTDLYGYYQYVVIGYESAWKPSETHEVFCWYAQRKESSALPLAPTKNLRWTICRHQSCLSASSPGGVKSSGVFRSIFGEVVGRARAGGVLQSVLLEELVTAGISSFSVWGFDCEFWESCPEFELGGSFFSAIVDERMLLQVNKIAGGFERGRFK